MSQHKNKNNNNWYIRVYNPKTKKSTTIRNNPNTRMPFKSKNEAKEYEIYYLKHKIDLSMKFDDLFKKYVFDYLSLRPSSSADKLCNWYSHHIGPVIGKRKITSIRLADLEGIAKTMLNNGYSINYINKMTSNIKTILNFGVSHGFLDKNPVLGYKPLRNVRTSKDAKYWTPREFKIVIDSIPQLYSASHTDPKYVQYFLTFGYLTGARKGEIRALRWIDIEFHENSGVIYFDRHINEKNEIIRGRKNGNGYIFHMDKLSLQLVREIHKYFSSFAGFDKNGYVFPSLTKKGFQAPIGGHTPTRWVEELASFNKLNNPTFHGLRTSNVCWLATEVGLTPYEVADRIGDSVEVVLKHYYSFFQESRIKVADKISEHDNQYLNTLINRI